MKSITDTALKSSTKTHYIGFKMFCDTQDRLFAGKNLITGRSFLASIIGETKELALLSFELFTSNTIPLEIKCITCNTQPKEITCPTIIQ